jgi:allantoinase
VRVRIANGTIITADTEFAADVLCENGRIAGLLDRGVTAQADEVLDATGMLVFPGFIDPHVHSRDPGQTHKEDFSHSTLAALCGGVTTILEMPNALPPVTDARIFQDRADQHEAGAWVDFGLWGMALGADNLDDIPGLFDAGAVAIKLFWGYGVRRDTYALVYNSSDVPDTLIMQPPDHGVVWSIFRKVAQAGGLLAAHCEDPQLLEAAESGLGHPVTTYDDFLMARSDVAEASAVAVAAQLARATACRFHVVHMASAAAVDVVRSARAAGVPITAETCPQYLTLTEDDYESIGPLMKVYPPVRTKADQAALWAAVEDGTVASIGSDHAPHSFQEKSQALGSQPAGFVGVETMAPVLLDAMSRGRLSPRQLAGALSEQTARIFGIWPQKGAIRPGSDADLTIVDPDLVQTVANERLHSLAPLSPWAGRHLRGVPVASVLGGQVAMRDGAPVGEHRGKLLRALRPARAAG